MNEAYFERFLPFAHAPSLEPIARLTQAIGNPERRLRFVHVAGTNGKGSITTMTAEIARASGIRTGLYTSPYLVRFHERIRIDGEPVSDEALGRAVRRIAPAVERLEAEGIRFAQFDAVTAAALCCFEEAGCGLVCWETGLGGRCDASNVIPPESLAAAVIAPIGLDHCAALGPTIPDIAREKAGIIKEGCTVVVSAQQPEEALAVLYEAAARKQATLVQPSMSTLRDLSPDLLHPVFSLGGEEYRLRLLGKHQFQNAAAALETVRVLRRKGYAIPEEAVRAGLQAAELPARLQILRERPLLLADGAHNPHGAAALADYLGALRRPCALVIGTCADKDSAGIIRALAPAVICAASVPVPSPRSMEPEKLAALIEAEGCAARPFKTLPEALAWAEAQAGEDGAAVVCGSLFLCGELLRLFPEKNP